MEKLSKETVENWTTEHKWLKIGEGATPNGRTVRYLTPSGEDLILVYDLESNLVGVGRVVQAPQSQGPGITFPPGSGFLGKG